MLAAYVVLDGYDFGAGIVHLFFGKTEKDKKAITNAIGPFWDANEVWLIAAGGIWPRWQSGISIVGLRGDHHAARRARTHRPSAR